MKISKFIRSINNRVEGLKIDKNKTMYPILFLGLIKKVTENKSNVIII